jgi:hypothetical protein
MDDPELCWREWCYFALSFLWDCVAVLEGEGFEGM